MQRIEAGRQSEPEAQLPLISRRNFLKLVPLAVGGALLASQTSCDVNFKELPPVPLSEQYKELMYQIIPCYQDVKSELSKQKKDNPLTSINLTQAAMQLDTAHLPKSVESVLGLWQDLRNKDIDPISASVIVNLGILLGKPTIPGTIDTISTKISSLIKLHDDLKQAKISKGDLPYLLAAAPANDLNSQTLLNELNLLTASLDKLTEMPLNIPKKAVLLSTRFLKNSDQTLVDCVNQGLSTNVNSGGEVINVLTSSLGGDPQTLNPLIGKYHIDAPGSYNINEMLSLATLLMKDAVQSYSIFSNLKKSFPEIDTTDAGSLTMVLASQNSPIKIIPLSYVNYYLLTDIADFTPILAAINQ